MVYSKLGVNVGVKLHLCNIVLLSTAEEGKPLTIKISVDYSPPLSFTLAPPSYRAASALTLTCEVENVDKTARFDYEWTSDCVGTCFVSNVFDANASTPFLHSSDSGVHTCSVYDGLGCIGSANITVNVVGEKFNGMFRDTSRF